MEGSHERRESERVSSPPTSDGGLSGQRAHEVAPNGSSSTDHISCPVSPGGSNPDALSTASIAKNVKAPDECTAESGALSGGAASLENSYVLATGSSPPHSSGEPPKRVHMAKPKIRIKLRLGSSPKNADDSKTDHSIDPAVRGTKPLGDSTSKPRESEESACNRMGWQGNTRENFSHGNKRAEEDEEELAASIFDELEESDYATSNCEAGDHENKRDDPLSSSSTAAQSVTETTAQASCGEEEDDLPMMSLKTKAGKKKKGIKTERSNISTLDASKITPKPDSSSTLSSFPPAESNATPSVATATTVSNEPKKTKKASNHSHPKSKLFSGTLRSAAAAHRNRQIHVPPIGSPGLLMLPNPTLVANFPKDYYSYKNEDACDSTVQNTNEGESTVDEISKWLHNGYLLPQTVFEQSMIAGGYTFERRQDIPHRGSSTQRIVGDMFDSDVSLYLHFPELIPLDIWDKRLGDKNAGKNEMGGEGRKKRRKISGKTEEEEAADRQGEAYVKEEDELNQASGNTDGPLTEQFGQVGSEDSISDGGNVRRPRLVDMVILNLSKLTGVTAPASDVATLHVGDSVKPDLAASDSVLSSGSSLAHHVTSDLTPEELPKFTPSLPGTRKRRQPYQPMSFLDMIPISLTSTYPAEYVKKRQAYVQAVKEREHAIIESQEAADDAVDNKEKYQAHKEAWDRMFEYQKQQIAKRESAAEEAERKTKEEGHLTGAASSGDITDDNENNVSTDEPKKKEDPMDYMPPPPEPPPPERFVTIPAIPVPPSPPSVLEIEDDLDDERRVEEENDKSLDKMYAPKLDPMLIQHLDPACFLPTVEGRYFGLLSNAIADPQFVGYNASGIRGVTSGGGTGLATSYVGGGRGAAGLVSGSLRGGNQWQQPRETQVPVSTTSAPLVIPKPVVKKAKEHVVQAPVTDNIKVAPEAPKVPLSTSSTKKKKRALENEDVESDSSNKKVKRVVPLATGDRNTTATEIASGPAGPDFPDGWTVKTYRRAGGETIGKTDRFWFSRKLSESLFLFS
eukprot:CCRYP_013896-RA/>CCRYP_013896-RA protein AED:0.01 eAED:0.01 QI:611/1/1/1/0.5/0.33/3/358/1024